MLVGMRVTSAARSSFLAAAVLAGTTLAVFGASQNYGPAAALRRFHVAVEKGDYKAAERMLETGYADPASQELVLAARGLTAGGAGYQVARMERLPREVRAVVVYGGRNANRRAVVWVVEKTQGAWRIDARKTLTILRDALGG